MICAGNESCATACPQFGTYRHVSGLTSVELRDPSDLAVELAHLHNGVQAALMFVTRVIHELHGLAS